MTELASTLIHGATLIDGTGAAPLAGAAVLFAEGRIAAVGPEGLVREHPAAAGAELLDARGCWIIPGLVDSHIHATLIGLDSMPVFLACGVTTVRDVGGPLDIVRGIGDQLARNAVAGPRFVFCGPLIDGEPASFPDSVLPIIESTPSSVAAADLAERCIDGGAGAIKLYFRLPEDSLRAAIARVGGRVPVTGHLGHTRASTAVDAGIDCFEHAIVTLYNDVVDADRRFDALTSSMADGGFWAGLLVGWAGADLDGGGASGLLEAMRERDVTLDPTLGITRTGMGSPRPQERDPNLRHMRKDLVQAWDFLRQASPGRPSEERETAARGHAALGEFVRRYHALGGRVIAGTDVGAVAYLVPGFSLHSEMGLLVEAGLSAESALRAATLDAARALRIDRETGSIEAGKAADLVLLEADPLTDIANVARVRRVVRAGVVHEPHVLLNVRSSQDV